jgi:23S rRNA (pseudouridine1915-N3)-methyltransferase
MLLSIFSGLKYVPITNLKTFGFKFANIMAVGITLLCIGKDKSDCFQTIAHDFARKIKIPVEILHKPQSSKHSVEERITAEHDLIMQNLPVGATVIVLDKAGKQLSSEKLSENLSKWLEYKGGKICFVIGGPDGVSQSLKARADFLLSFGPMIWPHRLVKVMLLEQIFRAEAILTGHPYHRA